MTPFALMCLLYLLLRWPKLQRWPGGRAPWEAAAGALGIGLLGAGAMHFIRPGLFEPMVPAGLPRPDLIVLWSGVVEAGVGLLLLVPGQRQLGGGLAALLFLAIWPANVYTAVSGNYPEGFSQSALHHWIRVPFQLLYVGWAGRSLTFDGSLMGQLLAEPDVKRLCGAVQDGVSNHACI